MNFLSTLSLDTIVLIAGFAIIFITMIIWHRRPDVKFDIKSVVVDKSGKFSLSKFGQLIALLVSTWIIIHQTRSGLLTEWLFSFYMCAWSGTNLIGKYLDAKKDSYQGDYNYQRDGSQQRYVSDTDTTTPRNDGGGN